MIYIASPYSHPNEDIRHQRYVEACKYAGFLIKQGIWAFSPIAHSHPIAQQLGLDTSFALWCGFDLDMLSRCDKLHVLMLPGWEDSKGITAEIEAARRLGIDITYIDTTTL